MARCLDLEFLFRILNFDCKHNYFDLIHTQTLTQNVKINMHKSLPWSMPTHIFVRAYKLKFEGAPFVSQ